MAFRMPGANPVHQLRDEVDRLFSGFIDSPLGSRAAHFMASRQFPAINVWEGGDNLFAEAEVPGLKTGDVDISVVGNELTIKGQRPGAHEEPAVYLRRERCTGPFERVVRLPVEVDANKVRATLQNGVLLITLPKTEHAKPKKIQVDAGL
jgi:HSP20 family protein